MEEQGRSNIPPEHRGWLANMDDLAWLIKQPAWKTYTEEILDVVATDLQNMLLSEKVTTIEVVQAIRFMLKVVVKLRDRPQELMRTAKDLRRHLGIPTDDDIEETINA